MTRARDNSFNPFNNQAAGKNFIINGAMDFWQRGTSSGTVTGSSKRFIVDRYWHSGGSSNISYSASRQSSDLTGFQYFIRLQRTATTTGTEPIYFAQDLETVNSIFLAGKTVTVSFYARKGADYSAGDIRLQLRSGTGTDESTYSGFTNSTNIINGVQFFPTTSWVRYQASVTVPTNSTQLGVFLYFYPSSTAGTNDYIDITGLQLEVGSTATHFSRAGGTIGGELALCQRYYYKSTDMSVTPGSATFSGLVRGGTNASGNRWIGHFSLPVTMRVAPTCTVYNPTTGVAGSMRNEDANTNVTVSGIFGQYQNTITQIDFSPVTSANNVVVGYIVASAEL